jgi:hypothetical protein
VLAACVSGRRLARSHVENGAENGSRIRTASQRAEAFANIDVVAGSKIKASWAGAAVPTKSLKSRGFPSEMAVTPNAGEPAVTDIIVASHYLADI